MDLGHIVLLQVANLGRIRHLSLELSPEGQLLRVCGPNDAGKSTLLNAVRYALEGASGIPKGVITVGQERAMVRIETSNGYIIERKIRTAKSGEQVTDLAVIKAGEGAVPSAQGFLDSMRSRYPDPAQIAFLPEKQLFAQIAEICGIDLAGFDRLITEAKGEASVYRKQLRDLGAEPAVPPGEPVEPANAADILRELDEAKARRLVYQSHQSRIVDIDSEIEALRNRIRALKDRRGEAEARMVELGPYDALEAVVAAQEQKLAGVEAQNATAKQWEDYLEDQRVRRELTDALSAASGRAADAAGKRDLQIAAAGNGAGLQLSEEGSVAIDGVRWELASTSERLRRAVYLAVAQIPEGGLRYLYLQRGESLGQVKLEELGTLAKEYGVTMFVEQMVESKPEGEGVLYISELIPDDEGDTDDSDETED